MKKRKVYERLHESENKSNYKYKNIIWNLLKTLECVCLYPRRILELEQGILAMYAGCFRRRLEAGKRLEAVESNLGGGIQI